MAPQGGDRLKQVPSMTGDRAVERAPGGCSGGLLRKSSHGSRAQGSPCHTGTRASGGRPGSSSRTWSPAKERAQNKARALVPGPSHGPAALGTALGVRDRLVLTPAARRVFVLFEILCRHLHFMWEANCSVMFTVFPTASWKLWADCRHPKPVSTGAPGTQQQEDGGDRAGWPVMFPRGVFGSTSACVMSARRGEVRPTTRLSHPLERHSDVGLATTAASDAAATPEGRAQDSPRAGHRPLTTRQAASSLSAKL